MNTIRAIIFDLDGVICFTDQYHYQAWKEMADAEGIYFDETINGRLRGVSRMESLDIILEKASREYTQEEKEQLAARKNESYVRLLEKMSPDDLSQEVKKTLEILRQRGYKLAIGSSSKNTKKILTQIGLNTRIQDRFKNNIEASRCTDCHHDIMIVKCGTKTFI